MKAVISNRIYMEVTREYKEYLEDTLTYVLPRYNPTDPPEVLRNIAQVRNDLVSIPSGRFDLIPEDYEIVDRRLEHPIEFPDFKYQLRDSQQLIHDQVEGSCRINAKPSWGKTFTGLAIAGKLGQKTLVVCHTVPLRNQWEKETKKVYGISPGIIGSGRLEVDKPIVIGNIQSLYRNIPLVRKEFGTVILDEFHHVSAKTFSSVIDTNYARNKIGLSATTQRKDGKHVVFQDYFGTTVYSAPRENSMTPSVDVIKTDIRFQDGARTPWAVRVNALCDNEQYQHLVAMVAAAYVAKGHKVLLVAQRVQFLKKVAQLIGPKAIAITGEIKDHDEREALIEQVNAGDFDVLCGTQSIFSEGISVNVLSCLIPATPISNDPLLEQLIGRIERIHPNKLNPKIVDLHLIGNTARRQQSGRMGYYLKQGYAISQF